MKDRYVSFYTDGTFRKIYINQAPPHDSPWILNPDLSAVKHLPPDQWRLCGVQIVPAAQVGIIKRVRVIRPRTAYLLGIATGQALMFISWALLQWLT